MRLAIFIRMRNAIWKEETHEQRNNRTRQEDKEQINKMCHYDEVFLDFYFIQLKEQLCFCWFVIVLSW